MKAPFAMRDVSVKHSTLRSAKAAASVSVSPATIRAIRSGKLPKADPIGVAKVAAIQAAKNTSLLIPHCHQVPLDYVSVDIVTTSSSLEITTEVKAIWKTGVEMEALVAASTAALTLYDMLKIVDDKMEIRSVTLLEKKGGKSATRMTGKGLTAAVLVMSDSVSKGNKKDISGKVLVERLKQLQCTVSLYEVLPDDRKLLEKKLVQLSNGANGANRANRANRADKRRVDMIITTGGTGMGPRDVSAEATLSVITRRMPGVEEALRSYGQDRIPMAMLSRGVAGVRNSTLIINLPGSVSGVEDGIRAVFPAVLHTFRMMKGGGH